MYVNVTSEQFDAIRKEALRMEDTLDTVPMRGLLAIAVLDNGGDYDPILTGIVPVELRVIDSLSGLTERGIAQEDGK